MKLLFTHSDYIEYEAKKKAIEGAEQAPPGKTRIEECLVVFTSAEEGDNDTVVGKAVAAVQEVAKKVEAANVVIYPFVHLTSKPAKPRVALKLVKAIEEALSSDKSLSVSRAPFGWYKAFELRCKGHPLSELSKEIRTGAEAAEKAVKKIAARAGPEEKEIAELPPNDHRVLGRKLDLYSFQEYAPGMAFFHHNGMVVLNELVAFLRSEQRKRGYSEIRTPLVMKKDIWEISGHWEHYKDSMFFTEVDGQDFAIKPMNCPGAILVFKSATRSYRDLPLRLAEVGHVHRNELSGVLSGLFRLRYFVQDDAHIFLTEDQLEDEILAVVDMVDFFYRAFGFSYHVELSTRPENFMGAPGAWDKAEAALESALKRKKLKYKLNEGEGAFYGPKIDFHIKDSLGRTWQCATVQVDFQMPARFDVAYTGEDNKPHTPVIVHRVVYGSLERFLGILVEHYNGAFPLWLAPVQARVLNFTDRNKAAAKRVAEELREAGLRVGEDFRPSTVEYKVRDGEMMRIPYIIVIGDKEEKSSTLAVRKRGGKPAFGVALGEFISRAKREIEQKVH